MRLPFLGILFAIAVAATAPSAHAATITVTTTVDELNTGDDVEITYRLSGRKWQRDKNSDVKFFLSAEATEFKVVSRQSNRAAQPPSALDADDSEAVGGGGDDDVPF